MSDHPTIRLVDVGKMYRLYASRFDTVLDGLGLARFLPGRRSRGQEFWALRGIDLELREGQRLGVIGRNGAGKSTLLKLLTGNIAPTEGSVEVRGQVHALIDAGGGFHPEFTGYENIRAALTYQGFTASEIRAAEAEIAEFTELGDFLSQPFKTYSLGMQTRLTFATATAVRPEILIIDEILGAGDAYFFSKALERTRELVGSGASVIIVSHALDQIVRLCEQAVWLERGRVVKKGSSLEVVKSYEQFVRVLEDRRLRAKNRKLQTGTSSAESFAETILIRLTVDGPPGSSCEVREISLERDGDVEERVLVGDAQDSDPSHPGFVVVESSRWSEPERTPDGFLRRLTASEGPAIGTVAFNLYWVFEESVYGLLLRYGGPPAGTLGLEVYRRGRLMIRRKLECAGPSPRLERVSLGQLVIPGGDAVEIHAATGAAGSASAPTLRAEPGSRVRSESRWPGEGSLEIVQVRLLGADGREQAVFSAGTPMSLSVVLRARKNGVFEVVPVAVLYRVDGIRVFSAVGKPAVITLDEGGRRTALLRLGPINLGNGRYVFSVALYRSLDAGAGGEVYDLVDRSYECEVLDTDMLEDGIFRHPAEWSFE